MSLHHARHNQRGNTAPGAPKLRRWIAALLCLAVVAASCGSDDDETGDAGGESSDATESGSDDDTGDTSDTGDATETGDEAGDGAGAADDGGAGGAGADAVTDYLAYVGGTEGPADPDLEPISIGWLNQQGGQQEIGAAATDGAELAVQLVNEQLGGIDGHPVELKTCFVQDAEEEGTTCGQELGNDESITAIAAGGVAIGIQPFYATIDGSKPVMVGVAATPVDTQQENSVILFGDSTKVLGPFGTYARDVLEAETAALIYPDIAGSREAAASLIAGLTAAGVEVESVSYAQGQTDLIGPLTAAGAQDADMVIPFSDASGCVNQANALIQLGIEDATRIVSAPLCLNPTVAEGLGGDYPLWTYAIASSLFGDESDPGMAPYVAVTEEYGVEAAADPWVIVSFSVVLTTIKFLNELGPDALTTEAILETARNFSGPVALGAPALACGKYADAPAVCNDQAQFFTYAGGFQFDKSASWLQPPE